MRPDGRYAALLILSIVFLMVFLLSSSRSSVRCKVASASKTASASPDIKSPVTIAAKSGLPVFPVDINTAGHEELVLLPGVGEKTAQRIIEKRKELGGFRTVDQLTEVKWIGKARLDRMRNLVTVNGGGHKKEAAPEDG